MGFLFTSEYQAKNNLRITIFLIIIVTGTEICNLKNKNPSCWSRWRQIWNHLSPCCLFALTTCPPCVEQGWSLLEPEEDSDGGEVCGKRDPWLQGGQAWGSLPPLLHTPPPSPLPSPHSLPSTACSSAVFPTDGTGSPLQCLVGTLMSGRCLVMFRRRFTDVNSMWRYDMVYLLSMSWWQA